MSSPKHLILMKPEKAVRPRRHAQRLLLAAVCFCLLGLWLVAMGGFL